MGGVIGRGYGNVWAWLWQHVRLWQHVGVVMRGICTRFDDYH